MKNLCTKDCKFLCFFVCNFRNRLCILNKARVCSHDSVHILPCLDFLRTHCGTDHCSAEVRTTAAEGCDCSVLILCDESCNDRNFLLLAVFVVVQIFWNVVPYFIKKFSSHVVAVRYHSDIPCIVELCRCSKFCKVCSHHAYAHALTE